MPSISIILPTYNYARYLPIALNSIFKQTYKSYEVIVINDASTDNTKHVLRKYQNKIKYIEHKSKKGFPASLNDGLNIAKGKYLNFLSADDLLFPQFLEKNIAFLEKNTNVGLVHSPSVIIDSDGQQKGKQKIHPFPSVITNAYEQLLVGNFICLTSALTRKEIVNKAGIFSTAVTQMPDWDMWLRVSRQSNVGYLPEYLSAYRKHNSSLTADIKKSFENIGIERKVILTNTINPGGIPSSLRLWMPFLFFDAYFANAAPRFIAKPVALFSTGLSIIVGRLLRIKYR